jgi:ABC-2 type transport system ATP-binding protein
MSEMAIRAFGLAREFGSTRAVDGLSLEVPKGTVFGFLGPNGAGKTTTIRLLLGLLSPTAGRAEVLGYDVRSRAAEVRKRSGALLEHAGLYERLTAEDNLEFSGRAHHLGSEARGARIRELLSHLGLWERRREVVGTWSRGMKQKLAVARALLHRPQLVFLDEPTAGLDPVAAAALREDLASLVADQGLTVFLTTHNLAEAERLCDQVGVIRRGKLLAVGAPGEIGGSNGLSRVEVVGRGFGDATLMALRARPEVSDARQENGRLLLDVRDGADLSPVLAMLLSQGARVEEVRRERASLEETFLALVEESR